MRTVAVAAGGCIVTGVAALFLSAPVAGAEPAPPPGPLPAVPLPEAPPPGPAIPDPVTPGPAVAVAAPAVGPEVAPPDGGVPHLVSPQNLPPGSTMDPTLKDPGGPNTRYVKDLWQAVQNQEISGKEALIMGLAQRGMNTPYPQQAAGPNVPVSPAGSAAPPPAPGSPPPPAPAPAPLPQTP